MDLVEKFQSIKNKVSKAATERDQFLGRKQQMLSQLEEELGCATLEDAVSQRDHVGKKLMKAEKEVAEELMEFAASLPESMK